MYKGEIISNTCCAIDGRKKFWKKFSLKYKRTFIRFFGKKIANTDRRLLAFFGLFTGWARIQAQDVLDSLKFIFDHFVISDRATSPMHLSIENTVYSEDFAA